MASPAANSEKSASQVKAPHAIRGKGKKSKQSFYTRALDEAEGLDFELAQDVDGIDDEIALLRLKIKALLENDPDNIEHIIEASNALSRLAN